MNNNWNDTAIITIDMQRDTLPGGRLHIKGTETILNNSVSLLNRAREFGVAIFHVVRIYLEDGSNAEPVRRRIIRSGKRILSPGDEGTEIFREFFSPNDVRLDCPVLLQGGLQTVGEREFIMYKSRWGAFFETELESELRNRGIARLIFTGVNFPNCPRTSIYEASERDFDIIAVKDAISGIYEKGIQELSGIGVGIATTAEILDLFNNGFYYRVFVREADGRDSVKTFSSLEEARRYADDAASEVENGPVYARVVDPMERLVYEGRHYAG